MKRLLLIFIAVMALIVPASSAYGDEYYGDDIRIALLDGDGAEFIVPASYPSFDGLPTEFLEVLAAANWVAYHMIWTPDPSPPGDVWTSSDQQLGKITPGVEDSGTGDCEDFSILLCAIMRYSIGIPADRVWVQAGMIAVPELGKPEVVPPITAHAYVVYKAEIGGIWYIEPQWGEYSYLVTYRGSKPSVTHWYSSPPYVWGESAQLKFNDEWVKGGGPLLAGPRWSWVAFHLDTIW